MSFNHWLLDSFYCHQKTALLMNSHRHRPKSALTQVFYHHKISQLRRSNALLFYFFQSQKLGWACTRTGGTPELCWNFIRFLMFVGLGSCIEKFVLFDKSVGTLQFFRLFWPFWCFHFLIERVRMDKFCWVPRFILFLIPLSLGLFFNLFKIFQWLKFHLAPSGIGGRFIRLETFPDFVIMIA